MEILTANPITDVSNAEISRIKLWDLGDPHLQTLINEIPQRMQFGDCTFWTYYQNSEQSCIATIGFSTLEINSDYQAYNDGKKHLYVPLLAVNPDHLNKGYGTRIVQHLLFIRKQYHPDMSLFLDVYKYNTNAIRLYEKCGLQMIKTESPLLDPSHQNNEYYVLKFE